MSKIHPVILSGGNGTRLWPLSRASAPKPFLPLVGEKTLFEGALGRVSDPAHFAPPIIVSGAAHGSFVAQQAGHIAGLRRIEEPAGRNTAPAIGLAALMVEPDDILLICPSDHFIADEAAFTKAALDAAALARDGWLTAFGIAAVSPETGYGYIKRGSALSGGYQIERFVEKPDLATAMGFLADGGFSWNGGIFCLRAGTFMDELTRQRPAMAASLRLSFAKGEEQGGVFHPDRDSFLAIEGDSIDYAVMEGAAKAAMVPVSMGWSDIGNWPALRDVRLGQGGGENESDEAGNVVIGAAELVNCRNVMAESDGPRISAIGLEDVIIIVNGDEVMVTSGAGAQLVGKLQGAVNQ